jgi:hypothetical protein
MGHKRKDEVRAKIKKRHSSQYLSKYGTLAILAIFFSIGFVIGLFVGSTL